ncbi:phosphoribosyltransferase [Chloroflexota bacterium]
MLNWQWLNKKLKQLSVKGIVYFLIMLAIGEGIWAGLSKLIESPVTRDIGFLVVLISAIFAATWYLSRRTSVQPAAKKAPFFGDKIPLDTKDDIFLEESPSWEQVYAGVEYLSGIITKDYNPDIIVGVSSGGAVVAGMLSRLLNKPLTQIVRSNPQMEETKPSDSTIISIPISVIRGKRILMVDDIIVTGKTLSEYCEDIRQRKNHPAEVRCAALLLAGERWEYKPDFYAYRAARIEVRMPWDYIKIKREQDAE